MGSRKRHRLSTLLQDIQPMDATEELRRELPLHKEMDSLIERDSERCYSQMGQSAQRILVERIKVLCPYPGSRCGKKINALSLSQSVREIMISLFNLTFGSFFT